MPRRVNRSVVQFAIFIGVFLFILYINGPGSTDRRLAWNEIRYKPRDGKHIAPRGTCPGLAGSKKPALVVARVAADGDTSWIDKLSDKYQLCVYNVDAPSDTSKYLQVPANRAHEAIVYLTFIIDNYYHIPESGAVFVHGSRWAWHNDEPTYDNAASLAALDTQAALQPWGYHNLRCDWSVSTCPASARPQGSLETSLQAIISPWDARSLSDSVLPAAFQNIFGDDNKDNVLGRHDTVRSQCCAQFIVGRKNILQHSLEEYTALRQWLLDIGPNAAPRDDRVAGRILSYIWHILFIRREEIEDDGAISLAKLNKAACPRAADCYCRLYGLCDLDKCTDGHCYGQYKIPPDFKIPDDWALTHL